MMTAALLGHVSAYAAQVRAHLADLPSEQVEDLTDGLEADLAEALADPDARPVTGEVPAVRVDGPAGETILDLAARFGSPADYAAELRSAAGLPPVADPGVPDLGTTRWEDLQAWWAVQKQAVVSHPSWPGVSGFAESIRPAWWVARGWVLFGIFFTVGSDDGAVVAPRSLPEWVVLLGLVWVSVELGRGRWDARGKGRPFVFAANVLAAVFLIPGVVSMASPPEVRYVESGPSEAALIDGVYVDGSRVTNLFVYDADGEYVEHAQILDNQGRAVRVDEPGGRWIPGEATLLSWVPLLDVDGREVRNAYPVPTLRSDDYSTTDEIDPAQLRETAVVPPPPVRSVAPLDLDDVPGVGSEQVPAPGTTGPATGEGVGPTDGSAQEPAVPGTDQAAPDAAVPGPEVTTAPADAPPAG